MRDRHDNGPGPWLPAVLVVAMLASLALALPGCGNGSTKTSIVRMGYLQSDLHQLAYYVAKEKGFYTAEGLDVREAGAFSAGPEEMGAFSSGALDMGYVGVAPAVTFVGQNMANVKIVAQANEVGSAIVVRNGLEGEDVAALKGRTVAVPGFNTVQDFLLRMALEKKGLKYEDVSVVVVKPPEMVGLLSTGQLDAFVAWEPFPSQAIEKKSGRVLEYSSKIWPHHPCCMLVANAEFLKKNPETVRKVVAAHVKATEYINRNPLEAGDMGHLFTGQDQQVTKRAMKNIRYSVTPNIANIERYVGLLRQYGVIKVDDVDAFVADLVDTRFLPGG